VFSGSVVAVQGDSTMRCTVLTVFYEQRGKGAERTAAGAQGDSIKQLDCTGPVTVVSKDQVATGDNATFDRVNNKVILTGNAALSQCQNVTRGERIVYDMNTGVANVETAPGGRVRALFVPGSDEQQKQACQQQAAGQAPAPAPPQPQPAAAKPAPAPQAQQPASAPAKAAQKQRAQAN
jgi:lipopolysaccharide export system protein LptA